MSDQPIEHCYPVVPRGLIAGEYPRTLEPESSQAKIDALLDYGVTTFVDLTEDGELMPYAKLLRGARHHRFAIRDASTPASPKLVTRALDLIDETQAHGGIAYVHCWGGIGRTGVIIGCWLARHGEPGEAALARLQALWRQCPKSTLRTSPETEAQRRYILDWGTKVALSRVTRPGSRKR